MSNLQNEQNTNHRFILMEQGNINVMAVNKISNHQNDTSARRLVSRQVNFCEANPIQNVGLIVH